MTEGILYHIKCFLLLLTVLFLGIMETMAQDDALPQSIPLETLQMIDSLERAFTKIELETAMQAREQKLRFLKGFYSHWNLEGQWSNEDSPMAFLTGSYGTASANCSSGFWRSGWKRHLSNDDGLNWGIGYGFEWMRTFRYEHGSRQLNQAFFDVRYQSLQLTIGMKQETESMSPDRLPLMAVRLASDGYQPILTYNGMFAAKASVSYGLTTGQSWDRIFHEAPHQGFHAKQALESHLGIRIGRYNQLNIVEEVGIGVSARNSWHRTLTTSTIVNLNGGAPEYLFLAHPTARQQSQESFKKDFDLLMATDLVKISLYDSRTLGDKSVLWNPSFRLGSDLQGVRMAYKNIAVAIEEHRFDALKTTIAYRPNEILLLNISFLRHPEQLIALDNHWLHTDYIKSPVRHSLYAHMRLNIPLHFLKGLFFDAAISHDVRHLHPSTIGLQAMLSWNRTLSLF